MSDTLTTLATLVGARLKDRGVKLAAAESCTGGWVAQAVTSVSGSSDWFERGFVTYSNDAKREMLGVRAETLDRCGAVSEETAREMALGALAASRAQLSVAITGVAGNRRFRDRDAVQSYLSGRLGRFLHDAAVHRGIPHDPFVAHLLPSCLELRLDQGDRLGAGPKQRRHAREDQFQRNERHVDRDDVDGTGQVAR